MAMFLVVAVLLQTSQAFVIAPPWANDVTNPCSKQSWQLIYWPLNGKCYQIFEQGPCPRSQELAFNEVTKTAECRCPKDLLYWPAADRCYPEFGKGPCELNQYLERDVETGRAVCRNMERCDNGWIFWPSQAKCFELYTQGPCHKGDLLIMNPLTAEPYCGCDPLLLRQYYFPPLKLCYEHYTRGPCEAGLLFAYNHTSDSTHCMCDPRLDNYHPDTEQCFQFGTKGPCQKGQVFSLDPGTGKGTCTCKDSYVLWPENGECYKAFTPGPCNPQEFIVPAELELDEKNAIVGATPRSISLKPRPRGLGVCVRNPCPRAHLYFPTADTSADVSGPGSDSGDSSSLGSVQCHKVGSQGPCPLGQLVVFEKYSGKSYRGECGCSPGYNQNYWPDTGQCYEWYSQGPCPEAFLFQYNKDLGRTECVCDAHEGFVYWNETGHCYRVYTQGPCPEHAWLIPGEPGDDKKVEQEVFCECRTGFFFDQDSYTCKRSSLPVQLPYSKYWAQHLLKTRPHQPTGSWGRPRGSNASPVQWSQGVFVNPNSGTGTGNGPERRYDTVLPSKRRPGGLQPDYSWIRAQWEATSGSGAGSDASGPEVGWGAQALPRVARSWHLSDDDDSEATSNDGDSTDHAPSDRLSPILSRRQQLFQRWRRRRLLRRRRQ